MEQTDHHTVSKYAQQFKNIPFPQGKTHRYSIYSVELQQFIRLFVWFLFFYANFLMFPKETIDNAVF